MGILEFVKDFNNKLVFFRFKNFIFLTYGLISALAWVCAVFSWQFLTMVKTYNVHSVNSVPKYFVFIGLPSGVIGARIMSIFLDDGIRKLFRNPIATIFRPGFWYHGAIIMLIVSDVFIAPSFLGVNVLCCIDMTAVAGVCYDAVSRLACFTLGCCYGRPAKDNEWGVVYTNPESLFNKLEPHLRGKRLIPAQLYGFVVYSIGFVFLFMCFCIVDVNEGVFTGLCFVVHFICRLIHEKTRGDNRVNVYGTITVSKIVSFLMAVGGLVFSYYCQYYIQSPYSSSYYNHSFGEYFNLIVRSVVNNILPYSLLFCLSFLCFGVHYKKVGSFVEDMKSS